MNNVKVNVTNEIIFARFDFSKKEIRILQERARRGHEVNAQYFARAEPIRVMMGKVKLLVYTD